MLMGKDGATHYGQIRIGANKIMGQYADKGKELFKGGLVYHHGGVLLIENYAVFIVVHIGRILECPVPAAYLHGDDPVGGSCRVIHTSCISYVLNAQLAFGITR